MKKSELQEAANKGKRWTSHEDSVLIQHVQARPQNLHYCFLMVADILGRSESAVAGRWYTVVSRKPEALCFVTTSPHHVSKNRKNGMGEPSNMSIWKRILNIIKNL